MAKSKDEQRQLRVWWIPQVPGEPFLVEVNNPVEGRRLLDILAEYDLFQFNHRIKPDYSNAGGLHVFNKDTSEWEEWTDEDGNWIDDFHLVGRVLKLDT